MTRSSTWRRFAEFPGEFCEWAGVMRRRATALTSSRLGTTKKKKMWYFGGRTPDWMCKGRAHQHKNHANVLSMENLTRTTGNQTFDVRMCGIIIRRRQLFVRCRFQVYERMSTRPPATRTACSMPRFVGSLSLNNFHGTVLQTMDAGNRGTQVLGRHRCDLGTGRPLINMNPTKWITRAR